LLILVNKSVDNGGEADKNTGGTMGFLHDHVIAITGGCGDIGRATAGRLSAEGARVVLLDLLSEPEGQKVARAFGDGAMYFRTDVTDRPAVEHALNGAVSKHRRLDAVISNAGIVMNQPFLDIEPDKWAKTLAVNLTGCFHVAQTAARIMVRQEPQTNGIRGRIVFTGSWVQDMPFPEGTSYIVSKAGVKAMARNMAQELATKGIRVNVLAPGIVMAGLSKQVYETNPEFGPRATAAIPLGEFGTAEQVAEAFAFLCGPQSSYMTGSVLLVDGGASLVKRQ
jgi:NAD(P)-dependent dehydrogenase (short-subunit alcohol dehydrogenase family)